MDSKNPSFDMKYCACVLIAFVAGTISMAVDYIYAATGVKSKHFEIFSNSAVTASSVGKWIVFAVRRGAKFVCFPHRSLSLSVAVFSYGQTLLINSVKLNVTRISFVLTPYCFYIH